MSPPNNPRAPNWTWKDLAPYAAIALALVGGWSASNERMTRLEERMSALQTSKNDSAASTQRELDRLARALEALQGDIKNLTQQLSGEGRRSRP